MKLHRIRQICCSQNSFSPSTVLWQHFVLPNQPHRHQRLASTTAESTAPSHPTPKSVPIQAESSPISQFENKGQWQDGEVSTRNSVADQKGVHKLHQSPRFWRIETNEPGTHTYSSVVNILNNTKKSFLESEDYDGVVIGHVRANKKVREQDLPWATKTTRGRSLSAIDRLSLEISKFHEYVRPSENEAAARKNIIKQVKAHTKEVLPGRTLEVFGSERSSTALARSDIDLRLLSREESINTATATPPTRKHRLRLLKDLHKLQNQKFQKHEAYYGATIRHARYPLISMRDRKTRLDIQIVLSNDTAASRDTMQQYMQEYPNLRQVFSVVKTIFDSRGLSDVYRGGIGSYSIFMMLVASIVHRPHVENAASHLTNFLQFWGKFKCEEHGISIDPPLLFNKTEELVMTDKAKRQLAEGKRKPLPAYMLCLRDPADPTNDLGRKGVCFKHVQATLRHLNRKLHNDLTNDTRASLLKPLIGDIYELNKAWRERLDKQGQKVREEMVGSLAQTAKIIRQEGQLENKGNKGDGEERKDDALNPTSEESESPSEHAASKSILESQEKAA